jgi:sugar phosphate isomerase/epimerase
VLALEQPSQDPAKMEKAFAAAVEIGVPIVNCGPGGKKDDEATFQTVVDSLGKLADRAKHFGVMLCFKAHVGQYVYNTPSTLKVLAALEHPNLGLDMDPSHIWRADENPVEAIAAVIKRVRHVHIRDCKGRQQNPGIPEMQTNGRGDIDLLGYIRVLHEKGYDGPVDL